MARSNPAGSSSLTMLHHYPSSLHKKVGGIRPSFVHTAFVHHLNLLKFTCTWLTVHVETQKFHTTLGIKIDPRPESRPLSNPHGLTVHKSLLRGGFGRLGQKTAIYRGFSTRSDELFSRRRAPRSGACAAGKKTPLPSTGRARSVRIDPEKYF